MSGAGGSAGGRFEREEARRIVDEWAEMLAQVIESMTEQRPEVRWQPSAAPPNAGADDAETCGWEQPFSGGGEMRACVRAPREAWEHAGALALKAAGIETADLAESKKTWIEMLGQSLSSMATSIGASLGREVTCGSGAEGLGAAGITDWLEATMTFEGNALPPLAMGWSGGIFEALAAPPAEDVEPAQEGPRAPGGGDEGLPVRSRTFDLLMDVQLPVSISFGKTRMPMRDVLKLTTGSIVELNRGVGDLVDVLVNHCLIARGEVVVVEGNYGVRIQRIADRHERLGALP